MLPFQLQSLYSFPQQIIFEKHVNSHEAEEWVRYVPARVTGFWRDSVC